MGSNCALLVSDVVLVCYVVSFQHNQADVVDALKSTSNYLDDLLNIDNPYLIK